MSLTGCKFGGQIRFLSSNPISVLEISAIDTPSYECENKGGSKPTGHADCPPPTPKVQLGVYPWEAVLPRDDPLRKEKGVDIHHR